MGPQNMLSSFFIAEKCISYLSYYTNINLVSCESHRIVLKIEGPVNAIFE